MLTYATFMHLRRNFTLWLLVFGVGLSSIKTMGRENQHKKKIPACAEGKSLDSARYERCSRHTPGIPPPAPTEMVDMHPLPSPGRALFSKPYMIIHISPEAYKNSPAAASSRYRQFNICMHTRDDPAHRTTPR